jgi:predicted alpha-1,2-mannosidase
MLWWWLACRPDLDPTAEPIAPYDPIPEVDPFIGTGGGGYEVGSVNPGALVPYGMVKLGPDTSGFGDVEYLHCAGYYAEDTELTGFSHTHGHGIGIADFGAVLLMPRTGFTPEMTTDRGRKVTFDPASEAAEPGYYTVAWDDTQGRVTAELTATQRAGYQRYTFTSGDPVVVLDLGHALGGNHVSDVDVHYDETTHEIVGFQRIMGSYSARIGGLPTRFAIRFDPAPSSYGGWTEKNAPSDGLDGFTLSGDVAAGLYFHFPAGTTEVRATVGISYVDTDGAKRNLDAEIPAGTPFDAVRAAATDRWREQLANVRVSGGTDRERRIFHTALYHAYQMPTRYEDVDGRYRGNDDAIHTADFGYYNDFSLWDTFRTLHPWLILARPDDQVDMGRSLVRMAEEGGALPRWPMATGETGGMVGSPADQVLAEMSAKGLDGWPEDEAFEYALAQSMGPTPRTSRPGIDEYRALGYVPWEASGSPAALTLEYAWSDAAMAAWAQRLGRPEADQLAVQGESFKNTYDASRQFVIGRHTDGSFTPDFDPNAWADDYVEGNAWQYLWMAPQDVAGMIAVQNGGDAAAFLARLDDFWQKTYGSEDNAFPDVYYWHGNEPDLHYAYLASMAGDRQRSIAPIEWIRANRYDDAPAGLDGNDDSGTLSAWYLWSALGLYPVAGTDRYALGAPLFDRAEVDGAAGTSVVRRVGDVAGPVAIDGVPIEPDMISHEDWVGHELTFGTSNDE